MSSAQHPSGLSPRFVEWRRLEAIRLMLGGMAASEVSSALSVPAEELQNWYEGRHLAVGAPVASGEPRRTKRIRGDQKLLLAPYLQAMDASTGVTLADLRYLCTWLLGVTFDDEVGEIALEEMGYVPEAPVQAAVTFAGQSVGVSRLWRPAPAPKAPTDPIARRQLLFERLERVVGPLMQEAFSAENLALGSVEAVGEEVMRAFCEALITHTKERAPNAMASILAGCESAAAATLSANRPK